MVRKIIIYIDGVLVTKNKDGKYGLVSDVSQTLTELNQEYETIGIVEDESSLRRVTDLSELNQLLTRVSCLNLEKGFLSELDINPYNDVLVSNNSRLIVKGQNKGLITFAVCYERSRYEELRGASPDFFIRQFSHITEWLKLLDSPEMNKILGIHSTTKGQHYVPNHFLKNWCVDGSGTVWVNTNGMVHSSRTEDIAKKAGIYSLEHLTIDEWKVAIPILKSVVFDGEHLISSAILDFIIYTVVFYEYAYKSFSYNDLIKLASVLQKEKLISKSCAESLEMLMKLAAFDIDINYLKKALKRRFVEGFEPVMCIIEQEGFPLLDKIRNSNLAFWGDNEETASLIRYIAYQLMRTRKFSSLVNRRSDILPKVMRLLRPIYAERITRGLFKPNTMYVATVINDTMLEFITGDCPLLNLALHDKPKYFDLFFPVSRRLAFFMCEKGREFLYPELKRLTVQDVHDLNKKLSGQCISQVYASSKEILNAGGYRASFNVDDFEMKLR